MSEPHTEAPLNFDVQAAPEFTSDRVTPDHTASGGTPINEPPPPDPKQSTWRERVDRVRRGTGTPTTPPRQAPKREKPLPPMPRPGSLAKPLTEMYGTLGLVVFGFDQACGTAIISNAGDAAKSLEELARVNPAARRVLVALTQTGAFSQVIAAHLPILTVVAVHHGPKDLSEMLRPLAVHLNSGEDAPKGDAARSALGDLLADMPNEGEPAA